MAPRPEDDTLTESELAELKRNLLLLSGSGVQNYYRDSHNECSLERKPNPKAMQRLVTAWKAEMLRKSACYTSLPWTDSTTTPHRCTAMDCPHCKLVNPPTAARCDCGYDFQTGTMKESYLTERDKQLSKPVIVGSIFITVILARIAFNLLKAAAEERSAWPLVVALAILGALSGFWIWKKKKTSR